jgi:hypothetical protein
VPEDAPKRVLGHTTRSSAAATVRGVWTPLLALAAVLALATGCGSQDVPTARPTASPAATPTATASSSTPPADLGRAFRHFARGGPLPPLADQVDLYLGNASTGVLTRQQARRRTAWATCTELGSYAAATCPLSPLTPLRRQAAVSYAAKPQGLCLATYGPVPPDLRELTSTVVVPRPGSIDTCAKNFAVQLFADDDGRLVAVSTLLGEP